MKWEQLKSLGQLCGSIWWLDRSYFVYHLSNMKCGSCSSGVFFPPVLPTFPKSVKMHVSKCALQHGAWSAHELRVGRWQLLLLKRLIQIQYLCEMWTVMGFSDSWNIVSFLCMKGICVYAQEVLRTKIHLLLLFHREVTLCTDGDKFIQQLALACHRYPRCWIAKVCCL